MILVIEHAHGPTIEGDLWVVSSQGVCGKGKTLAEAEADLIQRLRARERSTVRMQGSRDRIGT